MAAFANEVSIYKVKFIFPLSNNQNTTWTLK